MGLANYTVIDFIRGTGTASTTKETQITVPLSPLDKVDSFERTDTSWRDPIANRIANNRATVFRNPLWDGAVVVSIPLQGHVAQEIALQLFHSNDWMLISEIQFISGELSILHTHGS